MRRATLTFMPTVIACLWANAAAAQMAIGGEGERLAVRVCSECHNIGPGGEDGKNPAAPAFVAIAKRPSTTHLFLKVFLRTPHATMPNIILSDAESDAVSTYILELRGK